MLNEPNIYCYKLKEIKIFKESFKLLQIILKNKTNLCLFKLIPIQTHLYFVNYIIKIDCYLCDGTCIASVLLFY